MCGYGFDAGTGAGVGKPPMKETAMDDRALCRYGLSYIGLKRLHNLEVPARILRYGDFVFCTTCDFNELGVVKIAHSATSA